MWVNLPAPRSIWVSMGIKSRNEHLLFQMFHPSHVVSWASQLHRNLIRLMMIDDDWCIFLWELPMDRELPMAPPWSSRGHPAGPVSCSGLWLQSPAPPVAPRCHHHQQPWGRKTKEKHDVSWKHTIFTGKTWEHSGYFDDFLWPFYIAMW